MGPRVIQCTLLDVRLLTHDVGLYVLQLAEPLPLQAGQFIMVHVPQADGTVPKRAYSVLNAPAVGTSSVETIKLCVKHLPGGAATEHLTHCSIGAPLTISGPFGHFGLQPATQDTRRLFVATGTGVTPFVGMIEVLQQQGDGTATILAGFRHREDVLFRETLVTMIGEERVLVTLSQADESWEGLRGRVTAHVATQLSDPAHTHVYVCGNPSMVEDVRNEAERLGVTRDCIFFEKFTSHGKSKTPLPPAPAP